MQLKVYVSYTPEQYMCIDKAIRFLSSLAKTAPLVLYYSGPEPVWVLVRPVHFGIPSPALACVSWNTDIPYQNPVTLSDTRSLCRRQPCGTFKVYWDFYSYNPFIYPLKCCIVKNYEKKNNRIFVKSTGWMSRSHWQLVLRWPFRKFKRILRSSK